MHRVPWVRSSKLSEPCLSSTHLGHSARMTWTDDHHTTMQNHTTVPSMTNLWRMCRALRTAYPAYAWHDHECTDVR